MYKWRTDPEVCYYAYGEPYTCTAPEEASMQSYAPIYLQSNPRKTVRTLCKFLFQRFALSRIQLDTWDGNARTIRSYEKAGFQIEGRLRKATLVKGEPADMSNMGLIRQYFYK